MIRHTLLISIYYYLYLQNIMYLIYEFFYHILRKIYLDRNIFALKYTKIGRESSENLIYIRITLDTVCI